MKVMQKIAAVACSAALACSMGCGVAFAGSFTSETMPDTVVKGDVVTIGNGAKYEATAKNQVVYTTPKSTKISTAIIRTTANGVPVVSISKNAFKGCTKLKTVKVQSTKVSAKAVKAAVKGTNVKTIKVKKSQLKAYKKAFKGTGIKIALL